jgi:hypothetical protein
VQMDPSLTERFPNMSRNSIFHEYFKETNNG